jgi:glycosyltransferase involved in cell wall biosynthesis
LDTFSTYCRGISTDAIYVPNYGEFLQSAILDNVPAHVFKIVGDHNGQRYDHMDRLTDPSKISSKHRRFYETSNKYDALHVINSAIESRVKSRVENVISIPNFINDQPKHSAQFLRSRTIIAGGALSEVKNFSDMIRAFSQCLSEHPNWTLEIYGRGVLKSKLLNLFAELGVGQSVSILNPSNSFKSRLSKAAIHLSCSTIESFGLTLAEAMSFGVPVVSQHNHVGAKFLLGEGRGQIAREPTIEETAKLVSTQMQAIEEGDPTSSLRAQVDRAYAFSQVISHSNTRRIWHDALNAGIEKKREARLGQLVNL